MKPLSAANGLRLRPLGLRAKADFLTACAFFCWPRHAIHDARLLHLSPEHWACICFIGAILVLCCSLAAQIADSPTYLQVVMEMIGEGCVLMHRDEDKVAQGVVYLSSGRFSIQRSTADVEPAIAYTWGSTRD